MTFVSSAASHVGLPMEARPRPHELLLPDTAFQGGRAGPPVAPAAPAPFLTVATPQNAQTTAWRTAVCPPAPARQAVRLPTRMDGTPMSASSGSLTPVSFWQSPTAMVIGPGGQRSPFSAGVSPIAAAPCSSTGGSSRFAPTFGWISPTSGIREESMVDSPSAASLDRAVLLDSPQVSPSSSASTPMDVSLASLDVAGKDASTPEPPASRWLPSAHMRNLGA
mmetsp:Transcript_16150/g.49838  ORF Transcript_16150/g.49838 Transcript_16150/m.49838 type:complete len:222 (+) Transcript_16150:71-736(+)